MVRFCVRPRNRSRAAHASSRHAIGRKKKQIFAADAQVPPTAHRLERIDPSFRRQTLAEQKTKTEESEQNRNHREAICARHSTIDRKRGYLSSGFGHIRMLPKIVCPS